MPEQPAPSSRLAAVEAKRLLRLARTGALATLDGPGGAPLTTLVGVASDWDGAPLFLMSDLSRHTRNLDADPRASLLLTGDPGRGDPLNHPRLTVGGVVVRHPEPRAKRRYLQRNPKAKLYASFADFSTRRLRIDSIHFNGGFGRADAVSLAELLSPPGDFAALAEAEDALLAETEALGDETLARLAGASSGRRVWRPIGLDAEGLDLAAGAAAARVDFLNPVSRRKHGASGCAQGWPRALTRTGSNERATSAAPTSWACLSRLGTSGVSLSSSDRAHHPYGIAGPWIRTSEA